MLKNIYIQLRKPTKKETKRLLRSVINVSLNYIKKYSPNSVNLQKKTKRLVTLRNKRFVKRNKIHYSTRPGTIQRFVKRNKSHANSVNLQKRNETFINASKRLLRSVNKRFVKLD